MYSGTFARRHRRLHACKCRRHHRSQPSAVIFGALVVVTGIVALLVNTGVLNFRELWSYWPAILIALGATKVLEGSRSSVIISGFLLAAMGALLLLRNLDIFTLDYRLAWPLAFIALGFVMLSRALDRHSTPARSQ